MFFFFFLPEHLQHVPFLRGSEWEVTKSSKRVFKLETKSACACMLVWLGQVHLKEAVFVWAHNSNSDHLAVKQTPGNPYIL